MAPTGGVSRSAHLPGSNQRNKAISGFRATVTTWVIRLPPSPHLLVGTDMPSCLCQAWVLVATLCYLFFL